MGSELLFPFIASVIVILLFRQLDRSNYRLSQLKKHSSRMGEEINQSAIQAIQAVKDATIDLDIMNKQARKLISDVDAKALETKALMDTLRENREYLDEISHDLKDVVHLASDIRHESEYIQEGMKVIQAQREEIANVHSGLKDVKSEVAEVVRNFNDNVNQRTQNILESLATKIVELESLLEVKSDKLDESLTVVSNSFKEKLDYEVELMVQQTVGKVDIANSRLEDFNIFARDAEKSLEIKMMKFKDTTESIAEKIEKLDVRLEEKAEAVGSQVQDKLNSFERKFQERFENIYEQVNQGKEAFLTGMRMEVDTIRREIEGLSLESMTRRDEILNDTRRQAEAMSNNIQMFNEKYLEAENRLLKEADVKKNELFKEIHRFEEEFSRIKESFFVEVDETRNRVMTTLQNFESDMNRVGSQIEHNTRDRFLALKNELEDSLITLHGKKKSEILDDIASIELKIRELGKETLQKIKTVDDYFFDLRNALLESSKEIVKQVENDVNRIAENLDKEKSRTDEKIESYMDSWALELEKIKGRTNRDIDSLVERLKDIHIEGKELSQVFKDEFNNGKQQLDGLLKKNTEVLTSKTDAIVVEIQNRVKKSQDEAELILGRLQRAGMNLYEKQETLLTEYGEKLYKDLQNKLEKVRYESEEVLDDIQKAGMNLLEKQEEKIDKLNQTIDERINRQLTVLLDKGQLQLGQLESRIATYVQDVRHNIENTLRNAKEDSDRQINTFNGQVQKSFKEIEKANLLFLESNREEFNRTKEEFTKIKNSVDSDLARVADIKKGLAQYLEDESKGLKQELDRITSKIDEIKSYSDLYDKTLKMTKEADDTINKLEDTLEELKSEGDTVGQFVKQADLIRSAKKEMEAELRLLDTQRIKIGQIENELTRASNLCDLINERTDELNEKISMITSVDQKLIEIERVQNELEFRLSEVKIVNERLGEITHSINSSNKTSFEVSDKVQKLVKIMDKIESREEDLEANLHHIEEKFQVLHNKSLDIKSIEGKFDKVENLMNDLSGRHKQIVTMQKRIESMKEETEEMRTGFESLLAEADEKFDKLSDFLVVVDAVTTQQERGTKPTAKNFKLDKDSTEILKRKKATVLSLYEKFDWTSDTIAQKLNLEKSLVDAIINNK